MKSIIINPNITMNLFPIGKAGYYNNKPMNSFAFMQLFVALMFVFGLQVSYSQQYTVCGVMLAEDNIQGNARFVGTGGSMGAVGANLSSILINPAGTAVYENGEFSFSTGFYNAAGNTTYFDEKTKTYANKFAVPNIGVAVNLYNSDKTALTKFNMAFSINKTADFNKKLNFYAQNHQNSILDDMLYEYIYGNNADEKETYSYLAYNTNAIYTDNNGDLVTVFNYFDSTGNVTQFGEDQYIAVNTYGTKREFTLSLGAEFHKKILLGLNVSVDNINYEYERIHTEKSTQYTNPDFAQLEYTENFSMFGIGYSASLGVLIKPIKSLSFGGAVHSSSKYNMSEEFNYSMYNEFNSPDADGYYSYESNFNETAEYKYSTPMKLTGNIAYVYKNIGFLNFDYERVNYSRVSYDGSNDFIQYNKSIENTYKAVNTYKLGGELRYGSVSFRGGFAMFEDALFPETKEYNKRIAGGFGIRGDKFYFDAAYTYTIYENERNQFMYYDYEGYSVDGTYTQNLSSLILSVGVKF